LRDTIADLLGQPLPPSGLLDGVPDRELADELLRRGWTVAPPD
jgi:hypothetical protein